MELTFASMFAGCGGGDLGLTQAGWKCVWSNEIDKNACKIYRKNFGENELVERDIRDISTKQIPDFNLLIGGFPCQSFSLAGKRKGTTENRGTLFTQIVRVASAKRPKLLLLENVKGLLSSDDGRDFAKIIRVLGNLGYILEWQVLNSKYFGVPQNRERVFIIGHLGTESSRQIFPIGESKQEIYTKPKVILEGKIYPCGRSSMSQRVFDKNGPCTALTTQQRGIPKIEEDKGIRILTPLECERLQGFPDNWSEGISDNLRYKMLGNAMTVPVIKYLGHLLGGCIS
jgi:DNA (cytosine-5)-methyltransferase 1